MHLLKLKKDLKEYGNYLLNFVKNRSSNFTSCDVEFHDGPDYNVVIVEIYMSKIGRICEKGNKIVQSNSFPICYNKDKPAVTPIHIDLYFIFNDGDNLIIDVADANRIFEKAFEDIKAIFINNDDYSGYLEQPTES